MIVKSIYSDEKLKHILMTYYAKYLKEIRRVSDSTGKHYQGALKHISRYLVKKEKLKETVYEIQNIESLERIREYLYADPEFLSLDKRGHPYMEGHHALSMKYQNKFSKSLDVYANIICLCPICHRLLHYGIAAEKETVLDKIYFDRSKRFTACGIKISKEDFKKLAM